MDKSRLLSQFDLLEKYVANKSSFKSKEEEVNSFRTITAKILSLLEGPDRIYRDVVVKHTGQIDALVNTLQTLNDSQTSFNIIKIIKELVGKSNGSKRAQILVHHGVSKAILQCIYVESKEQCPCEDYLFLLHQVLYKVAIKDKRIGMRARISQCLPVIINLFRPLVNLVPHSRSTMGHMPISNILSKNILNILYVLRLYCQNLINASRLGRLGVINLLLKMISYSARSNITIFKVGVETLNLCVRTKSNSSRAVNHGAMSVLLELFVEWYRIDGKGKHLTLRKCILCVIKNMINLRSGRKAFLEADGLHMLYGFCDSNKMQNDMESLVTLASLILRKCFPRNRLPLSHYGSVMKCPLPNVFNNTRSRVYVEDSSKTESSPSIPPSASPTDMNTAMPLLHSHGDTEKHGFNLLENFDDDEFFTDENIVLQSTSLSIGKQNNRIRAVNLFRSLDRKILLSSKESMMKQKYQTYLNKFCSCSNDSTSGDPTVRKSPTFKANERNSSPYQDYNDDNTDKNDQNFVEQMLVNSVSYQPPDDRPFNKLKISYDKFLLEKQIWKNTNQESKPSKTEEWDKSLRSENSSDTGSIFSANEKRYEKSKEIINPSIISLEMKSTSPLGKKLDRDTLRKNELSPHKALEISDERPDSFMGLGVNCQNSDCFPSEISGMYVSSKRGSVPYKTNNINISDMINDLAETDQLRKSKSASITPPEPSNSNLFNEIPKEEPNEEFTEAYIRISSLVTRSLGRFSMISYPDLMENSVKMNSPEPLSDSYLQNVSLLNNDELKSKSNNNSNAKKSSKNSLPLPKKSNKSSKTNGKSNSGNRPSSSASIMDCLAQNKILDDLRRIIDSEDILEKVVFDLEGIIQNSTSTYNLENSSHSNSDELEVDKITPLQCSHLCFDSQFECGNLRKAIQIRQYEYDLILNPDVNNNHHMQWFYFRVSAMEANVPYRFNIINCEKPNSQFNFGMKPLLYSVKEALLGQSYWKRHGTEIFYYKNHFARSAATCGGNIGKSYYTFTFVMEFPYSSDVCYIAYHYPYTYTRLLTDLHQWVKGFKSSEINSDVDADGDSKEKLLNHNIEFYSIPEDNILFYVQELCTTILGNPVPVLTISNWPKEGSDKTAERKQYIFLTSRVHPGESNASWIMRGSINYLLSDNPSAEQLRDRFIFKIIPMLNPDGVINGCHRCSMAGHDLNRRWLDPCEVLNPTIFHTKGLLMLLSKYGYTPVVFCDFHGHSRRKNVFMFGCSPLMSWISEDTNNPTFIDIRSEDKCYLILPSVLNNISQAFSLDCCSFTVEKSKESTARVVVWRQFGVKRSYTMESSYCSCDQGSYKHQHINVPMLEEIGGQFVESLLFINDSISTGSSKYLPGLNQGIKYQCSPNKFGNNYESGTSTTQDAVQSVDLDSLEIRKNDDDDDVEEEISSNDDDEEDESDSDKEEADFNDEEDVEDSD